MAGTDPLLLQRHGGALLIGFADEVILDTLHIDRIDRRLTALVEGEGTARLALDLSAIKMIGSRALGVFIKLQAAARQRGGEAVLCGIEPRLYKVFAITGLDRMFRFFPTAQQAVDFLNQPSGPTPE